MSDGFRVAGISGSPQQPSRSKALLECALESMSSSGCSTSLIDLSQLAADALLARAKDPAVDGALATVGDAKIVVAATPTYRALYTGLLKCFFDLMPQAFLAGKLCVGLQTAAVAQHALALEYGLRPLFLSLDGIPVGGVFATDDEFADGRPGAGLRDKVEGAVEETLRLAS